MKKKSLLIFIMLFGMFLFPNIVQAQDNYINLYNLMKENASADTVNFSVNSMTSGTNGIYTTTATEGNVPVYYYRGAANQVNNNVIFNNMCWKIIRTTETGGVKLIYNGTPNEGKCEATGTDTQIGKSAFNTTYNDNVYVGYMYGTPGSSTYEATHANTNNSTIKTNIDTWYTANFDAETTAKLEDTVFCNDRTPVAYDSSKIGYNYTGYGTLGYGTNATFYGAANRAWYYTKTPAPTLVCSNTNDKFTVSSTNGNGALSNPVGLITLDEVVFAGYNTYSSNTSNYQDTTNYLHTGQHYWTFSPVMMYSGGYVGVGYVNSAGAVSANRVNLTYGVRPVVSLADGTLVEPDGEGTSTNPYKVVYSYKIKYVTNTSTIINDESYVENSKIIQPTNPIKEGYHFIGWYEDEDLTKEYDFNSLVNKDMTLYAKFEYDYTYKFLEGDNQEFIMTKIDNYKFRIDGDYDLFDSLVIDGLKLEKDKDYKVTEGSTIIEFTESGLTKLNTLDAKEYDIIVNYTNGKIAKGKLIINEPVKYTVTFNNEGNKITNKVENNKTVLMPSNPSKKGYTFVGWYTNEDLTDEYDFDIPVTKDITLYAKFAYNYTYKFLEGDNQKFEFSNVDKYKFRVDGDYKLFDKLKIDDIEFIRNKDYVASEGSTIIEFTESGINKLNALESKEYKVELEYTNGKVATGKLFIDETPDIIIPDPSPKTEEEIDNPKTYDGIMSWIILGLISISGLAGTVVYRKKQNI